MALWQAKQSWLTGHLLSAMTTGQSLSILRSCIGVSGGGLFCLHLYPSNIYKSLCQFLDSISTAVIILTEGIHSKYQFTPLTWHQVMVTELKTEQVCVTALGGEITPALRRLTWPEPWAKRETETKRCKYLHNRVFTTKMLALNSKSDQGLFWLELLLVMPINCAGQNVRFWGARMFYAGGNQ